MIWGYLAIIGYVFFLLFVAGGVIRRFCGVEISRKSIHILLFMVWLLIDIFFRNTIHQVIVPIFFLVLNALSYKFRIYASVERETNNHMGTVYFAMAITCVMAAAYFWQELYMPSGAAVFCLTFGDGFAALIGHKYRSYQIRSHKSVVGTVTCFVSTFCALTLFRWFRWPELTMHSVFLLALLTAVAELCENGLDNFSITFSVFFASYALTVESGGAATAGVAWALGIFVLVFFAKEITYAGSLTAMVMVFVFRYFGGQTGLGYLLFCYFIIFLIGRVGRKLNPNKAEKTQRNAVQIAINGGVGTVCILLYGLTHHRLWLMMGYVAIGGCLVDSVSSDVGQLSSKRPYDPLKRKQVPTGTSGGITPLGCFAAVIVSSLIGIHAGLVARWSLLPALCIGLLTLLQTVIDTLIGGLIQVKYRCTICGQITEKQLHCNRLVDYDSGVPWVNNNLVNLFSSVLTSSIAYGVLTLIC